ncbi:MAG: MutS-related protein [Chloroflexota bacterium]
MRPEYSSSPTYRREQISLLWPFGRTATPERRPAMGGSVPADLELDDVVAVLVGDDRRRERFVESVLTELCTDNAVIRYRQGIVTDLLADETLCGRLQRLLSNLAALAVPRERDPGKMAPFIQVATRAGELELHVGTAMHLQEALEGSPIASEALLRLRDYLRDITSAPEFQSLQTELPALRRQLDRAQSFTIGVNLTDELMPASAAILTVNSEKIAGKGMLLNRLFGEGSERALTPLRMGDAASAGTPENRLYRDLRKLLEEVAAPVAHALERYAGINAHGLGPLEPELAFFLNGVVMVRRLQQAGLPVCCPEAAPADARITLLSKAYHVSLALRMYRQKTAPPPDQAGGIITNPVTFDDDRARIWILTGPNRGGKTTFTQMVGLIHVLFQAGLYVPAAEARISPVDAIYTHFPVPETTQLGMGRLDEEAKRLAGIFAAATSRSLILLNEVLAGTSAVEGLGLATDAVRGLRLLGVRAIYATHLHDLAFSVEQINQTTPGTAQAGSLVADVEAQGTVVGSHHRRTFRILPGLPRGVSYASEIAEQNGISFGQISDLLRKRGVVAEVS